MDDKTVYNLYLYNDNINSFNRVVSIVTEILDWTVYQSEQCALMAHENERTILKSGTYAELRKFSHKLRKAGITAALEQKKDI